MERPSFASKWQQCRCILPGQAWCEVPHFPIVFAQPSRFGHHCLLLSPLFVFLVYWIVVLLNILWCFLYSLISSTFRNPLSRPLSPCTNCLIYGRNEWFWHNLNKLNKLNNILEILRVSWLTCSKKLCRDWVEYLGNLITGESIAPLPNKVKGIYGTTPPYNVRQVWQLLGTV